MAAKLYFNYGAMGSSKSAQALMTEFNYREVGKKALLVKPEMDIRFDNNKIISRVGLSKECIMLEDLVLYTEREIKEYDCIIVDEVQFATPTQVDFLSDIVDNYDVPVVCFGLRADFQNKLFPGSQRLLELADSIKEIKTVCWCGRKAICNARYNDKGIVRTGEQVVIGANDKYVALCRKHFKEGILWKPE